MAPTETNHGPGDVSGRPSPLEQHQPATQQTEPYPDSISLPQTPETAQRAFVLNDSDHPGIDVDNTAPVNLANGAPGQQGPHIPFMHSPPRPEACLTPPPPPATGLGSNPPWNIPTAWSHGQDKNGPLIGLGLLCPWAALAAGAGADNDDFRSAPAPAPAPNERFADRLAEEAVGDGSAASSGGQLSSSSSSSSSPSSSTE